MKFLVVEKILDIIIKGRANTYNDCDVDLNKELEDMSSENINKLYNVMYHTRQELLPIGIHGIEHSSRVAFYLIKLSTLNTAEISLTDKELDILLFCAQYHDIGRGKGVIGNNFTLQHGKKSARLLRKKSLYDNSFSEEERKLIDAIIICHSIEDSKIQEYLEKIGMNNSQTLKLIKLFKDADALDRVRTSDLDEKYLRFESSKRIIPLTYAAFRCSDFSTRVEQINRRVQNGGIPKIAINMRPNSRLINSIESNIEII